MHDKIIVDTSVLIALDKINLLTLLCKIYSEVWIPESVKKEFGEIMLPCIKFKRSKGKIINLLGKDLNLGIGESEVISLAQENNVHVLIDDLKARKAALSLDIKVSGTIGILIKAYQLKLISSALEYANKLRLIGFYISDELLLDIKKLEEG